MSKNLLEKIVTKPGTMGHGLSFFSHQRAFGQVHSDVAFYFLLAGKSVTLFAKRFGYKAKFN